MPNYQDKVDFYGKLYRATLLILVLIITLAVLIGVRKVFEVGNKIDLNVQNTRQIIIDKEKGTLEARKANVQRQEDLKINQENLKGYVKCITLARFDYPELISPTVTKQQVSDALDRCAEVE